MGSLEKRYAEALLTLTENAGQADIIGSGLSVLGRLFIQNQEFRSFILNPALSKENRSEALLGILELLGYIKGENDDAKNDNGIENINNTPAREKAAESKSGKTKKVRKSAKAKPPAADMEDAVPTHASVPAPTSVSTPMSGPTHASVPAPAPGRPTGIIADYPDYDDFTAAGDEIYMTETDSEIAVSDAGVILYRFLQLLLEKGRIAFLPNIAEDYNAIKAERRSAIQITVRSASPVDGITLDALRGRYMSQYGSAAAEIHNVVEPSLQGGYSVHIGGVRIDETVYGRLAALARVIAAGAVMQKAEAG